MDFDDVNVDKTALTGVVRNPISSTIKNDGDFLWLGPNIFRDSDSPTGLTAVFCYDDPTAQSVTFLGDLMLCRWNDPADLTSDVRDEPALIGDGLYEGGQSAANLNNLTIAGANYRYLRVACAHDFNTWCQLFTTYVSDCLWQPETFAKDNTGSTSPSPQTP